MADDLLQRLGELEREDNADFPHEWEAVVAGTMSAEEAARQRPDAAPDEQERLAELLTPLTDDGVDGLVDQLQAVLSGGASVAELRGEPAAPTAEIPAAEWDEWMGIEAGPPAGSQLLAVKGCTACHSLDGSPLIGPSFKGIYGPLGLVPLLLIWIYYSWLVTLIGAEVAYSVQRPWDEVLPP